MWGAGEDQMSEVRSKIEPSPISPKSKLERYSNRVRLSRLLKYGGVILAILGGSVLALFFTSVWTTSEVFVSHFPYAQAKYGSFGLNTLLAQWTTTSPGLKVIVCGGILIIAGGVILYTIGNRIDPERDKDWQKKYGDNSHL